MHFVPVAVDEVQGRLSSEPHVAAALLVRISREISSKLMPCSCRPHVTVPLMSPR